VVASAAAARCAAFDQEGRDLHLPASKCYTRAIVILATLIIVACQQDYRFDTVARYEATNSHYQLSVHAAGMVRAGDDLSRQSHADVTITPTVSEGSRIAFGVALPGATLDPATLATRLADAGYHAVPDELAESLRAIEGALSGPKATLMDGQTHALRVLQVTFQP
jgi:hypothetical protein